MSATVRVDSGRRARGSSAAADRKVISKKTEEMAGREESKRLQEDVVGLDPYKPPAGFGLAMLSPIVGTIIAAADDFNRAVQSRVPGKEGFRNGAQLKVFQLIFNEDCKLPIMIQAALWEGVEDEPVDVDLREAETPSLEGNSISSAQANKPETLPLSGRMENGSHLIFLREKTRRELVKCAVEKVELRRHPSVISPVFFGNDEKRKDPITNDLNDGNGSSRDNLRDLHSVTVDGTIRFTGGEGILAVQGAKVVALDKGRPSRKSGATNRTNRKSSGVIGRHIPHRLPEDWRGRLGIVGVGVGRSVKRRRRIIDVVITELNSFAGTLEMRPRGRKRVHQRGIKHSLRRTTGITTGCGRDWRLGSVRDAGHSG